MPQIGEIVRCKDLGLKGTGKSIWEACSICGRERWTRCERNKSISKICKKCRPHVAGQKFLKEKHWNWKGGKMISCYGYVMIRLYEGDFFYPMAEQNDYVMEHRLVMAKHLNRCLLPWETVHHKNGDRKDNRLGNLQLFPTATPHNALTRVMRYINRLELENKKLREQLEGL